MVNLTSLVATWKTSKKKGIPCHVQAVSKAVTICTGTVTNQLTKHGSSKTSLTFLSDANTKLRLFAMKGKHDSMSRKF